MKAVYGAVYGPFDYAGLAEVADYLQCSKQAVSNWRNREMEFPEPVASLSMGPIWRLTDIKNWAKLHRKGPYAEQTSREHPTVEEENSGV